MNIPRKPQDIQMDLTAALAELAALREELAGHISSKNAFAQNAIDLQKRAVAAEQRNTFRDRDAGRYRKLQLWMASNVEDGWAEVKKMGGICAWMSCGDMDEYLDRLPDCNVGLCAKPTESGTSEPAVVCGFKVVIDETMAPNEVRFCNCNQGRLPCTCKSFVVDDQARDS